MSDSPRTDAIRVKPQSTALGRDSGFEQAYEEAMDLARQLERELAEARRERDLAIAHDRQPYPTAYAYEAVCNALAEAKRDAERYRWLRGNGAIISRHAKIPVQYAEFGIGLDAAIDVAIHAKDG